MARTKKRIRKKKAKQLKVRDPNAASAQFRTSAGAMKSKKQYKRKAKHKNDS